jgi:hypothetical protein
MARWRDDLTARWIDWAKRWRDSENACQDGEMAKLRDKITCALSGEALKYCHRFCSLLIHQLHWVYMSQMPTRSTHGRLSWCDVQSEHPENLELMIQMRWDLDPCRSLFLKEIHLVLTWW